MKLIEVGCQRPSCGRILAKITTVGLNPETDELMVETNHLAPQVLATPPDVVEPSLTWTCPSCGATTRHVTARIRATLDDMPDGTGRRI